MSDFTNTVYKKYKSNPEVAIIAISDEPEINTRKFLLGVDTDDMPILLDNQAVARARYNIWDRVWFPGDPEVGGADVLSPYPYDIVIDMNGYVALVAREYEPDKIIHVMEELLGDDFVGAGELNDKPVFSNTHLKLLNRGSFKQIELLARGTIENFQMYDVQGTPIKVERLKNGVYSLMQTSSGVYFYRFTVDSTSTRGKILIP